ncbi:methyltransferase [Frondihabitans australicus]|uniref:Methyltransferase n=1 Tax=Frondihabitans australicus TaxID=386892 RepID=A0A495IFD2_9MICO|nr:methyltransferase [Frondihabitans australicus]RKR74644.1 hypothetical protein C8E83_1768 [Frondihabitans australicus]
MSSSDSTTTSGTWVAIGAAGAVGSIHRTDEGFSIRVGHDTDYHGDYPTLDVAKSALHARLGAGAERPEFVEH